MTETLLKSRAWLWLGVMVAAFALTGNRLALSRPSPNHLRFAHTFTTESERAILDAAIVEFQRSRPGVTIDQIVSNSEVYNTVGWRLQFRGRNQPDIYFHWQGFKVEDCIRNGWAMDLTRWLSPGFTARFVSSAIRKQSGGIYFLPQSVDISNLIWYDRDRFAHLNLREPESLEDWLRQCATIRRAGFLPLAQGNRDLWPMGNLAAEFLGQTLGADALNRLFEPGVAIGPRDVQGLKTFGALLQSRSFDFPGVLNEGAVGSLNDIDAKVLFLGGQSAQHILGSWFLADVQDARNRNELKFSVGVFPVPAAPGEFDAMAAVSTGYLVNPRTRNPGAAVEFLELLLSRKYQSEFARLGNLSVRRDAPEFTSDPLARRMLEILAATPVFVPPPDTGYRPEQAAVFYEMCGRLLTGRLDLPRAAEYWTREKENLARKGR
jgi:raffinose/stachyose/melibiose transport system substrate-binding protein